MGKKLSTKTFIISQALILLFGLGFIFGLNYLMNPPKKTDNYLANGPVTKTPASLTLEVNIDDDLLTFSDNLVITGKTLPKSTVLITSATEDLVVTLKPDGSFSADITLDVGVNEITVVTFDQKGDTREIKRTVFYSKEKV